MPTELPTLSRSQLGCCLGQGRPGPDKPMKTLCVRFTPRGAENYSRHLQLQTSLSPFSSAQHLERESSG